MTTWYMNNIQSSSANTAGAGSVSIGPSAGTTQGAGCVAIGESSGQFNQATQSVAVGSFAGYTGQGTLSVAVGVGAGLTVQSSSAVAIGSSAGNSYQGTASIAIGNLAASNNQGSSAIAIGGSSGQNSQGTTSISMGLSAGQNTQGAQSIAIGPSAGCYNQSAQSVSVGYFAGYTGQGLNSISVGDLAGFQNQGPQSVSIGSSAGYTSQGTGAVGIGYQAGAYNQGTGCVSIGYQAGYTGQGALSVCIGSLSGNTNMPPKSISINASGLPLGETNHSSLYVAPIRSDPGWGSNPLFYNDSTYEVSYYPQGLGRFIETFNIAQSNAPATLAASTVYFCPITTGQSPMQVLQISVAVQPSAGVTYGPISLGIYSALNQRDTVTQSVFTSPLVVQGNASVSSLAYTTLTTPAAMRYVTLQFTSGVNLNAASTYYLAFLQTGTMIPVYSYNEAFSSSVYIMTGQSSLPSSFSGGSLSSTCAQMTIM